MSKKHLFKEERVLTVELLTKMIPKLYTEVMEKEKTTLEDDQTKEKVQELLKKYLFECGYQACYDRSNGDDNAGMTDDVAKFLEILDPSWNLRWAYINGWSAYHEVESIEDDDLSGIQVKD